MKERSTNSLWLDDPVVADMAERDPAAGDLAG